MTPQDAFKLVNNLDVREALRKFSPQWSTVAVSESGEIVEVLRHKEQPTLQLNRDHLLKHRNSVQFTAWPERFQSVEELEKEIRECVWTRKNY